MIPTDDQALALIEHAMGGAYSVDAEGVHTLVGADFTLDQLLEFWSGYNPKNNILEGYVGDMPVYTCLEPVYTRNDVITALIAEVRRLRAESS